MRRLIRGSLRVPSYVIVLAALLVAAGGGATAGSLITGAQIKDGTVTGADVKNGSLRLKDLGKADAAGLKGEPGTNGKNGAAGQSAFAPLPSGTSVTGGGILDGFVPGPNSYLRDYASLTFTPTSPIIDHVQSSTGANLELGGTGSFLSSTDVDTTSCPGSAAAPTAVPGHLCVYVLEAINVNDESLGVYAGAGGVADAAENDGFYVSAGPAAAGEMRVRYVWTYSAP
jgi:hypothetical protein